MHFPDLAWPSRPPPGGGGLTPVINCYVDVELKGYFQQEGALKPLVGPQLAARAPPMTHAARAPPLTDAARAPPLTHAARTRIGSRMSSGIRFPNRILNGILVGSPINPRMDSRIVSHMDSQTGSQWVRELGAGRECQPRTSAPASLSCRHCAPEAPLLRS